MTPIHGLCLLTFGDELQVTCAMRLMFHYYAEYLGLILAPCSIVMFLASKDFSVHLLETMREVQHLFSPGLLLAVHSVPG